MIKDIKEKTNVADTEELEYLAINNENLKQATKRLNRELSKANKDKTDIVKELKTDIKHWRKELGRERRLKLKLEKELENKEIKARLETTEPNLLPAVRTSLCSEIDKEKPVAVIEIPDDESSDESCSICSRPIFNYVPKYFQDLLINPACSDCDDSIDDSDDTPG